MKKIPSVWMRGEVFVDGLAKKNGKPYINQVTPGCEWVLAGEGVATRKWDGTACLLKGSVIFARYDCKKGKTPPEGFVHAQDPDLHTGHWPGWVPSVGPAYQWIREAYANSSELWLPEWILDGTYEAIGPKIGGNPEGCSRHELRRHGGMILANAPRDFEGLKAALAVMDIEGVVFHHPDGRMAKATKPGFGLPRKP